MGYPIVTTVTLNAAVANGYAQSQSLGAAGKLTLNGSLVTAGVGTPTSPRRVIITSAGDDHLLTWTVVGTDRNGNALTESFAGANTPTVVQSTQDFATVTSISGSGATAGNVTAGTNGVGSGPWVPWDQYTKDFQVNCAANLLSGSPTYTVEVTLDDVYGRFLPSGVPFPRPFPLAAITDKTANAIAPISDTVRASRLTLTVVGSVELTQSQQGN